MTFVVRTVSRTADGREIVRTASYERDILTIGRDASNIVHLADLSVEPFHATLTRVGARVGVAAVGTLGFAVDGKPMLTATVDPGRSSEIRIGEHRLTLSREGEAVAVRIERPVAAEASDDRDRFTLKGVLPGKRMSAWAFVLLVIAAFVAAPLWSWASFHGVKTRPAGFHADSTWSSGPLSQAHRSLEGNCQGCHDQPFVAVEDAKCAACHAAVHGHADGRRQVAAMQPPDLGKRIGNRFKAAFGKPAGQRCVDCHTEHEGAGPMPATAQAFCTDCHATMKARLPDTRLANASDFGTDHPRFTPIRPANTLKFPHDTHLSHTNGVARMAQNLGQGSALACKDCHTPTADGVRFAKVEMEASCRGCHSLGYDRIGGTVRQLNHGSVAQAVADMRAIGRDPDALFAKGGACYDCHVIDRTGTAATAGWRIARVEQPTRFLTKGWFDHRAHSTESCASCHAAGGSHSASDLLIPDLGKASDTSGASCRSCHGGQASSAKVPSGCAMCHDYHAATPAPWRPASGARREVAVRGTVEGRK